MNTQFIKGLSIDWNRIAPYSYLREIEALHDLKNLEFTSPITFFVGENGSGKSTLLEAIAIAAGFNPEGDKQLPDYGALYEQPQTTVGTVIGLEKESHYNPNK